jgi:glycine C-acetyltransferase
VKTKGIQTFLETEAKHLDQAGLLRREFLLSTPQGPTVTIDEKHLINFASSDYLGLSDHAELKKAAKLALDRWGNGVASPRPVMGTLPMHQELERVIARFLGTDDALVYSSGYHANTGLFESLFGARDYIFCDEQIHPSLADGIRLCRARVYSYRNQDMNHLEDRLKRSRPARFRAIATDGVFAVMGEVARLREICSLADRYDAVVLVDDGQGVGVLGPKGKGTPEAAGVEARIDVVTGTFGNALGGGLGGYVAGRKEIVTWLRQKSRPHLVSSALTPVAVAVALKVFELIKGEARPREEVAANVQFFKEALGKHGVAELKVVESEHPAVSVNVGDAVVAQRIADLLYRKGVFMMGFCYPVVPEGAARIRAQVTAKHTQEQLKTAAAALADAAKDVRLLQLGEKIGLKRKFGE